MCYVYGICCEFGEFDVVMVFYYVVIEVIVVLNFFDVCVFKVFFEYFLNVVVIM